VVYIRANPQKHGFVDDFRDWKWSSYDALYTDKTTHLERAAVIDWFGGRQLPYSIHDPVQNQQSSILNATRS
jgi:putative transposase